MALVDDDVIDILGEAAARQGLHAANLHGRVRAAPSVIADEALGIGLAVKHLVDLGHLRIAYLVSTSAPSSVETARLNAYREALLANDIVPREGWVHDMRDMGGMLERGRFGMDAWLRDGFLQQGCTALMVQNDRAALGAMDVLVAAGIRVPDDLSVIGFDSTSECEVMRPRLTSVRIPLETIGSNAVHILTRTLRDEPVPAKTVFPATLDVRDSTGAPRATNHRTPF